MVKSVFDRDLELRKKSNPNTIKMGKKTVDLDKIEQFRRQIIEQLSNNFSISETKTLVELSAYLNCILQASININRLEIDKVVDELSLRVEKAFESIII